MTLEPPGDGGKLLPGQRRAPLPPEVQGLQDQLAQDHFQWIKLEAYRAYGHLLVDMEQITLQAFAEAFAAWEECVSHPQQHLFDRVMDVASWYRAHLPDPRTAKLALEELVVLFGDAAAKEDADTGGPCLVQALEAVDALPVQRKAAVHAALVFRLEPGEASWALGVRKGSLRAALHRARRDLADRAVDVKNLTEFLDYEMRRG